MKRLLNKVASAMKNLGKGRTIKRPERRASLKIEGLEERNLMNGMALFSYSLQQGNLYQVVGATKTLIDTGVKSYATATLGSTGYLVDLHSNGSLRANTGSGLNQIDSGVTAFAFASLAGTEYLLDLNSAGALKSNAGAGWGTIDNNVKSFAVQTLLGTNYLFDLNATGDLKETAGYGWSPPQDSNIISFTVGTLNGNNYIFDLNTSGQLKASYGNGWIPVDSNIQTFAFDSLAGSNYLWALKQNGVLEATSNGVVWTPEDNGISSFAATSLNGINYIFELNTAGALKDTSGYGWYPLDTGVSSFSVGTLGGVNYLFELNTARVLRGTCGTGWYGEDSGVLSCNFANIGGTDYVFDLTVTGALKASTGPAWVPQDNGIGSYAIDSVGGVNYLCEITYGGVIKYSNGFGWMTYSATNQGPFGTYQTPITNPYQVSVGGALYTDVWQGGANTCWLDSSIAAMESKGVDLSSRIQYQGNNWYTVLVWTRNNPANASQGFHTEMQWVYFDGTRVDADMQFHADQPGESWTIIMQRALIQVFAEWDSGMTIANPHSGGAADAQPLLTGNASVSYSPTDPNIVSELQTALANGKYVVMHATNSATTMTPFHVYMVLAVSSQGVVFFDPHGFPIYFSWSVVQQDGQSFAVN